MRIELPEIANAEKTLPIDPDWKHRTNDEWIRLVSPIDIDGRSIEGLRLHLSCQRGLPDRAVTFQIDYFPPKRSVKGGPICRIEWRPIKPHNNRGIGPVEHRHKFITECHYHPFDLNWKDAASKVRRGDLPIAIPIAEPLPPFKKHLHLLECSSKSTI